ncbi:MAG: hypothetical protein GVY23_00725 [Spirochaetes bacterium]|jgi:hypothetical protein|nr:hypothetical protein [Spirochaetota bacterium]
MKSRLRGAFVLIPVVYAGVILFLLFLQFSDGQRFYESTDGLTLEGRMTPTVERESSSISSVRVSYRGVAFEFNEEASLRVTHEDNDEIMLHPWSYSTTDSGFRIRFENDATLSFDLSRSDGEELRVRPELPEALLPASSISLPVTTTGGATLQRTTLPGIFPVRFESNTYHLAPPPRSELDTERNVLRIPTDSGTQTVSYLQASTQQQDVFTTWFSDDRQRIPADEYENTVTSFIDDAYIGWSNTRLNDGSGTWDMRSGSPAFSELILTATLAEAWQRDEYTPVFTDMRRAADQHLDQVSLLSAPFLGNLDEIREQYLEADERQTTRLLELARNSDPELFRSPGLAKFAIDRGSEELYRAVLAATEDIDFVETNMAQAIGMLRNYYLADFPTEESREAFSRFAPIIETRLLPNLYRAEDEGFFLRSGPGRVEVFQSIVAGRILQAAGAEQEDSRLQSAGRRLVSSSLALADDTGFLPAVLYVGADGLEGVEGAIGPERVYSLLSNNPAYPARISLAEEVGPGTWIQAVAEFTEIGIASDRYRFVIDYPRNRTHYIIMQGVPPFSEMELFGQQWRTDPAFESYIKGRHYDRDSQTLMIKYTDNSVRGEIILEY